MLSPEDTNFLSAWATCTSSPSHGAATMSTTKRAKQTRTASRSQGGGSLWTEDEHDRFMEALEKYPTGPWKLIADCIGTRTARQARTHAQKHKEKLERRQRKLQKMQSYAFASSSQSPSGSEHEICRRQGVPWTPAEHARLVEALELYPTGPWRKIAAHVQTRTHRQVMSYGRKHRQQMVDASGNNQNLPFQDELSRILEDLWDGGFHSTFSDLVATNALLETSSGSADLLSSSDGSDDEILDRLLFKSDDVDCEFDLEHFSL